MTPAESAAFRAGLERAARVAYERRHTHSIVEIIDAIRALPGPVSGAVEDGSVDRAKIEIADAYTAMLQVQSKLRPDQDAPADLVDERFRAVMRLERAKESYVAALRAARGSHDR